MSSVVTARRMPSVLARARPSKAWLSPALTLGYRGHGLGADRRQPVTGHELDQVAPVRADVGERPGRPTPFGIDAPVVVVLGGEPVLEVATVDQANGTDGARGDAPCLAHQRIEPVGERDDGHDPGGVGGPDQFGRLVAVDGQGLLADHVLAGGQGRLGERRAGCWACRCGRRRRRPRSPAIRRRKALGRPRVPGLPRALEADEAATPTNRAPARRAAWAWTTPMKPVPATATRGAVGGGTSGGPSTVDVSRALANASVAPSMVVMFATHLCRLSIKSFWHEGLTEQSCDPLTLRSLAGSLPPCPPSRTLPQPAVPAPGAGAILQLVRSGQAATRADLAALTGLARSTVAQRRCPAGHAAPGRPGRQPVDRWASANDAGLQPRGGRRARGRPRRHALAWR